MPKQKKDLSSLHTAYETLRAAEEMAKEISGYRAQMYLEISDSEKKKIFSARRKAQEAWKLACKKLKVYPDEARKSLRRIYKDSW